MRGLEDYTTFGIKPQTECEMNTSAVALAAPEMVSPNRELVDKLRLFTGRKTNIPHLFCISFATFSSLTYSKLELTLLQSQNLISSKFHFNFISIFNFTLTFKISPEK